MNFRCLDKDPLWRVEVQRGHATIALYFSAKVGRSLSHILAYALTSKPVNDVVRIVIDLVFLGLHLSPTKLKSMAASSVIS